ncbi:PEPxxWA-CTERM sorting domain-containing protein [Sphingomonas sp. LR60]|uniref:PEPxxWA-CTERM sorting domain-containing protein n=1 Tax=Sphingomonas sp. LR60 TaxID=3050233 RepID=UPI002FE2F55B
MSITKKAALAAMLLCGATITATSANAATPISLDAGSVSTSGPTDYASLLGNLAKFDSSLGALTAAYLTVGYSFQSTITVSATTDSTGRVRTESAAQFLSSDAGVKSVLDTLVNTTSAGIGTADLSPAAYDLLGTSSIYSVGPSSTSSQIFASNASTSQVFAITGASLAAFVANGGGSFDVSAKTLTGLLLSATGGNAAAAQQTSATSTVGIRYEYVAAPVAEPATWALMILGFGVVGYSLRRRSATLKLV